jgi:peptidoglycan/LPS O-acetylase OafA/YrhL
MQTHGQIDALHGLRGIAALAVVMSHMHWIFGRQILPQASMAVDLFFALSGFVIAHAYDGKLATGLSLFRFARMRLLRLYPLYLLGLLLGMAMVPLAAEFRLIDGYSRFKLLVSTAGALLFLPTLPPYTSNGELFPLNSAAWSLFWELVVNWVYAGSAVYLSKRRLQALILIACILLCATALHYGGLGGGAYWATWPVGGVRVVFSFFTGVYVRRYFYVGTRERTGSPLMYGLIVGTTALVLAARPSARFDWLVDLGVVVVVWPALILAASRISLNGAMRGMSHAAGEASYALYILHLPLLALLGGGLSYYLQVRPTDLPPQAALAIIGGIVVASALANAVYDTPIRAWLRARAPTAR